MLGVITFVLFQVTSVAKKGEKFYCFLKGVLEAFSLLLELASFNEVGVVRHCTLFLSWYQLRNTLDPVLLILINGKTSSIILQSISEEDLCFDICDRTITLIEPFICLGHMNQAFHERKGIKVGGKCGTIQYDIPYGTRGLPNDSDHI